MRTLVGILTVGISSLTALSSTFYVPRNPLRLIVSRFPTFVQLYDAGTYQFGWYLDTLDCTHQQHVFEQDSNAKRHRCAECAQAKVLALPPKKPAVSIPAIQRKKAA